MQKVQPFNNSHKQNLQYRLQFTKKLRNPNSLNNNELLDFLSAIPSDPELRRLRDLRPPPETLLAARKLARGGSRDSDDGGATVATAVEIDFAARKRMSIFS